MQKPSSLVKAVVVCLVVLAASNCNSGLGTINLKAELNFPDMGGLRPRANQPVYLLSNSIASPEMEEAFKKFMSSPTLPTKFGNGNLTESEKRSRVGFMSSDGRDIWHRYIVDQIETDSQGKASFKKVKEGEYWLYTVVKRPSGQWVLWNVKTKVDFYDTTNVTLNNGNISFTVN